MPLLAIYAFADYSHSLPAANLESATHGNDPAAPGYSASTPSWVGETFTFNGGAPVQADLLDDDATFEDGYVETGTAQTLALPLTIGGTTYPIGSVIENEFSLIDASGNEIYVVRIAGVNVGFAYQAGNAPTLGDTFTATEALDGDPVDNADGTSSSSEPYSNVICFAAGTMIDTPAGPKAVETIQAGCEVTTLDSGPQPVLWASDQTVMLKGRDDPNRPVLFPARNGRAALMVSQQHRMPLTGPDIQDAFGCDMVLAPAKALTGLPGVRIMRGPREIRYVHILLPSHGLVFANGWISESFYPGPCAMDSLSDLDRLEVRKQIQSAGRAVSHPGYGRPARPLISVGAATSIIAQRSSKRPAHIDARSIAQRACA